MIRNRNVVVLLSASALWLGACATATDEDKGGQDVPDRDQAIQDLQLQTGAPVSMEIGDTGATRVLAMTPRFHVAGHANDPVVVATNFVAQNHAAFNLSAAEATSFKVTRVDIEANTGLSHITLQRTYNDIAIWNGAITVHLDQVNGVYRALGDEFYVIRPPTNQRILTPTQAAVAAGNLLGLGDLGLTVVSSDADRTVFDSTKTVDQIHVTPKIFPVGVDDNRIAYQATLAWNDANKQLQYRLLMIDAASGNLLHDVSLVNDFTGRVFTASPGASPTGDGRTVVSFNGDPTASPNGWVGTARRTIGNNAVAATDLNANNTVGTNETQPTADANDAFDFPFNAAQDAGGFRAAAVTNAFFFVNNWHDLTYALGFTEAAGNFQTNNLGRGGAQNDEVQVDAQDGSGTNNANFGTPPDGQRPRMQMFLFNIVRGSALREDGDFDATVVYHENTHGLSNRLVGGGSTACLNGTQSGGMGEGWSDWVAASFLNDPIIGAYVTGDATLGIRRASMANSPFTYGNIKDRTMIEVHDAGEVWAATLWDVRNALGKAKTEQLVVAGMKLTPCSPTMLQARDAIIAADATINGGANRCALFTAFARRLMGSGASSPNHNSTTAIVTSTTVPADCGGGGTTRTFTSTEVPRSIPDNNATGVRSNLTAAGVAGTVTGVTVSTNITHTFRGDLVIQLIAPGGQIFTLSNRAGGSADNFVATDLPVASTAGNGTWQLFVRDLAAIDVGTINSFVVKVTSTN